MEQNETAPSAAEDQWRSPITVAGVYDNVSLEDYHGARGEVCPGPSISSSGLKVIEDECPYVYWWNSPLNPDRPEREEKPHFRLGRLLHELLEPGPEDAVWRRWHILPPGFRADHGTKWKDAIQARDAAVSAGLEIIEAKHAETARQMAARVKVHPQAQLLYRGGQHEVTMAWQDKETGVWLRVRPDFLPNARRWVPDYKSIASPHPDFMAKQLANCGWHISAALYIDGIRELYGDSPEAFMFVAQGKEAPWITEIYQLDQEAEAFGRVLYRRALRRFADCLAGDRWPTYGNAVNLVTLPLWETKRLNDEVKAMTLDVPEFR